MMRSKGKTLVYGGGRENASPSPDVTQALVEVTSYRLSS